MEDRAPALLVYSHEHSLDALNDLLTRQGVETSRVRDCAQAALSLCSQTPPILVFTAADLPDGSWEDILEAAQRANSVVPVIVVSKQEDVSLSLKAWESGCADCVAPPFTDRELARVVRLAMLSGFLATWPWAPAGCSRESLFSNAENHLGSGALAA